MIKFYSGSPGKSFICRFCVRFGKNGEGSANLLEQAGAFSVSNRYAVKWAKDNLDLSELSRLRWIEKWTVTRIANHLGWSRTAIVRKLGRMAKAPDSVVDGSIRSRIRCFLCKMDLL